MKTLYEYSCPKCDKIDRLDLSMRRQGIPCSTYHYNCRALHCNFSLNTGLATEHEFKVRKDGVIDSEDPIHWKCKTCEPRYPYLSCKDCINGVKVVMLDVLSEFIECTWGAHFMSVFQNYLKPHLNDLEIFKFFLKSSTVIVDQYNNKNGYKMYDDFYSILTGGGFAVCDSSGIRDSAIKEFLNLEFSR